MSWVEWLIQLDGHDYLIEVDPNFIKNKFNLFGLKKQFGEQYE